MRATCRTAGLPLLPCGAQEAAQAIDAAAVLTAVLSGADSRDIPAVL
jgi:hypothetical protein